MTKTEPDYISVEDDQFSLRFILLFIYSALIGGLLLLAGLIFHLQNVEYPDFMLQAGVISTSVFFGQVVVLFARWSRLSLSGRLS